MRKKTVYSVTGVLETKPTDLPDGLRVDQVEINAPRESIHLTSYHGERHLVSEGISIEKSVTIGGVGLLEEVEVRKLRDFLNMVLGEESKVRVLRDREGDVWFELAPDKFALGGRESQTDALAIAKKKVADETGYRDWTFDQINGHEYFGPAKFIENTWE
jgi:hypothetical protein